MAARILTPYMVVDRSGKMRIAREDIKCFADNPYVPLKLCCYSQSTESCVKLAIEKTAKVCGQEVRDGYIRAKIQRREVMPAFSSKKDMLETF